MLRTWVMTPHSQVFTSSNEAGPLRLYYQIIDCNTQKMRKVNTVPSSQNCNTSHVLFVIHWVQSFYVPYSVVLMSLGCAICSKAQLIFAPPKAMELICELPGVQDMACIAGAPMQVSVLEPKRLANLTANCTRTEWLDFEVLDIAEKHVRLNTIAP